MEYGLFFAERLLICKENFKIHGAFLLFLASVLISEALVYHN